MNNYPLIFKWLSVEIIKFGDGPYIVCADELEKKLADGFEVFIDGYSDIGLVSCPRDNFVALAIGKQFIKKQTQAEAALEFVKLMSDSGFFEVRDKAKKILEMKE